MEAVHVLDLTVAQSDLVGSEVVLLFFPCFGIHLHSSKPFIWRSAFVVRRADESRRFARSVSNRQLYSDLGSSAED